MRSIKAGLDAVKNANPNLVDIAAREVWRSRNPQKVADPIPTRAWTSAAKQRIALMKQRSSLRIGIPRVLNMYLYAPLFSAYLESLGMEPENLVYSEFTGQDMYRAGAGRGAIDPCFPSKVPLQAGERRLIISTCEKGQVEDVGAMRGIKAGLDAIKSANPNLVDIAAREVWRSRNPQKVDRKSVV